MKAKYKRVLLKLSGEALMGEKGYGIDQKIVQFISKEIEDVSSFGVQLAVVIGGGNIFRGLEASSEGMERTTADYMGMLATVLNALALQNALEHRGIPTRVLSAIEMRELAEPYIRRRAMRHLEKGRVIIQPVKDLMELAGSLKTDKKPVSIILGSGSIPDSDRRNNYFFFSETD